MKLNKELLQHSDEVLDSVSAAYGDIRGLYNSMQFVLRLHPDVQAVLENRPTGIVNAGDIDFPAVQAFSTYLHETIHWWQHVGSTSGLLLSLTYPAQLHLNHKHLRDFLVRSGPKKSILKYNSLNAKGENQASEEFKTINLILNNFFDIEGYRNLVINPSGVSKVVDNLYFDCMGHSYHIAYSSVLWLLSATFDPKSQYFPDPRPWAKEFKELRDNRLTGYYYKSDIHLSSIGLREIFEGQARFCQLQYLYFGSGEALAWQDFRAAGMLSPLYITAFEQFLELTESEWPATVGGPLVALFLLVCDVSINPSDGFPFNIIHFESFIESTDPGIRFFFLCRLIAKKFPHFKHRIKCYSNADYTEVSETLSEAMVCRSPLSAAHKVVEWSKECPQLIDLIEQGEAFSFSQTNLPVRVIFERFIKFCEDKVQNPEFFCWPGAWAAGERCAEDFMETFDKHQALFTSTIDGDIYPRKFPEKDERLVQSTFEEFYAWNIMYDLGRQWITEEGAFRYFFFWLSNKLGLDEYRAWAADLFRDSFGVGPNEFEVL
jgi:hypothetical protein